jgi:hypothetical protein
VLLRNAAWHILQAELPAVFKKVHTEQGMPPTTLFSKIVFGSGELRGGSTTAATDPGPLPSIRREGGPSLTFITLPDLICAETKESLLIPSDMMQKETGDIMHLAQPIPFNTTGGYPADSCCPVAAMPVF